jgi:alcohol dehydrogenase/L-iditol 2-dehydrogenase
MKAVVHFELKPSAVELRQVPRPTCGPAEALVAVRAVGVCGSDLHQRANHQSWPVNVPVILGHEFAGEIVAVGPGVTEFKPDDRVTSETAAVICGRCEFCRSGQYQFCAKRKGYGYGVDGAMAECVKVPERALHRLPEGLPFVVAALTEPCCVAYQAVVILGQPRLGETVVVFGPGTIGLLCLKMAVLSGCPTVLIGLERDRARLELGRQLGATRVVAVDREDLGGVAADLVVDAAGVSATLREALRVVRPTGRIVKVGWGPEPLGFSLDPLVQKAVELRGSFSHNYPVWERVLGLLGSGALDVRPLIGGTYPLADWAKAFDAMEHGGHVKSVIVPGESS